MIDSCCGAAIGCQSTICGRRPVGNRSSDEPHADENPGERGEREGTERERGEDALMRARRHESLPLRARIGAWRRKPRDRERTPAHVARRLGPDTAATTPPKDTRRVRAEGTGESPPGSEARRPTARCGDGRRGHRVRPSPTSVRLPVLHPPRGE